MLQDEGKLKVSDPVEKFIPEFAALKAALGPPCAHHHRAILTHTSGLGEGDSGAIKSAHTLRDLDPQSILHRPCSTSQRPLEIYAVRHHVAARIVEVTSGLSFDEFVKQTHSQTAGHEAHHLLSQQEAKISPRERLISKTSRPAS